MTEYFRIEGLNLIDFDRLMVSGTHGPYRLTHENPPRDMSNPMTRDEVLMHLPRLPLAIRGHALNRGMSMVSFPFNIQGATDPLMEAALHDFTETLEDGQLYIETQGARGTQAALRYKADGSANHSYKTIYYGYIEEQAGRDTLGARIKEHYLMDLRATLYMEPYWRPSDAITLGPNEIYCPSFEEDGDANGRADDWTITNAPVLAMESTIVLHGCYSQKVTTNAIAEGVRSTQMVAPAAPANDAIAYVWICRPAAGSDIEALLVDDTAPATRAQALYSTSTTTVTVGGYEWRRLECIATNNIVPGNNHSLYVRSTAVDATVFYADKAFWKWDTTIIPDEWCDHWLIYNHYDTTEGAAHEGHINYFDVDDLKGDIDARLLARVEFEQAADISTVQDLIVGRRSRSDYCAFVWWLETEDRTSATNWANMALARCSAGNCVSNAANAAGEIQWTLAPPIGANEGRFDVYGVVLTDDIDNTSYRLSYDMSLWTTRSYNGWVKQRWNNTWQLVYLGEVNFGSFLRTGIDPAQFRIYLEYTKDAADTVRADLIWLIAKDEPEMRLDCPHQPTVQVEERWAIGRDEDFDYVGHENATTFKLDELHLRGDAMTLMPRIENRLYLSCISDDTTHDEWEAHGASTDLLLIVSIDYLPQYVSPLE